MAKQFKRANRALRTIRTYLGRVIRDIGRKIRGEKALEALFAHELTLARRVRSSASISADARSIRCTRPRSNALAREKPIAPTRSHGKWIATRSLARVGR